MTIFWNSIADSKGFIVCSVPHAPIAGPTDPATEGAKFVAVRNDLFPLYNIDKNAVYANGFSGGGQVAFWSALESAGWAGNICFSSTLGAYPVGTASGTLPIYWKNEIDDPFFPLYGGIAPVSDQMDAAAAAGHNVHGESICPAGSSHSLGIQNGTEAWDWVTNPANKP
ncbi:MAG: hypothetical protein E3J72_19730 [Planctomycetota bacterium]|nr:MAG: hypothetical protein E3J72_19730 [Planctomycetota bacterium]